MKHEPFTAPELGFCVTAKKLLTGVLVSLAVGGAVVMVATGHTKMAKSPPMVVCASRLTPSLSAQALAQSIVDAPDGSTVCLTSGVYPTIDVTGALHRAYVTIRPVIGGTVTVAGMEVRNSSFLRFQGLRMSEGFNMRDGSTAASHDYQFVGNIFENAVYGIVLYGGSGPIRNVRIEHNSMRNIDFPGAACNPGYAGGQAVTLYYAEGVRIAHNKFKEISWHYIQGASAGPSGATVEYNLFEGPIQADRIGCTHLNVWQIWQGGINDTFSNNVVLGEPGRPAAVTPILFETGPGGRDCTVTMKHTIVSNNLFVDDATAYSIQIMTTQGLTVTHNTIVGSTYGTLVDKGPGCADGANYQITHNIDVQNRGNRGRSPDISLGGCRAVCTFDYNVSSDASAAAARGAHHRVIRWWPTWVTTSWNQLTESSVPAGYYVPKRLRLAAGYRPHDSG